MSGMPTDYGTGWPGAPFMDAYSHPEWPGYWLVPCGHCEADHVHTAAPGWRVSHCHDRSSPYDAHGYVLRYAGAWPAGRPVRPSRRRAQAARRP